MKKSCKNLKENSTDKVSNNIRVQRLRKIFEFLSQSWNKSIGGETYLMNNNNEIQSHLNI